MTVGKRASWRRAPSDVVTLELVEAVITRDRGCVPATLVEIGRVRNPIGPCRGRFGQEVAPGRIDLRRDLTIGHIQHGGGRAGKRARSDRRHTVAICFGHHLVDLLGTSREVQRACDDYLERVEGPVVEDRPWEVVARVRFATPGGDDGPA